jgi:hypothetical protein
MVSWNLSLKGLRNALFYKSSLVFLSSSFSSYSEGSRNHSAKESCCVVRPCIGNLTVVINWIFLLDEQIVVLLGMTFSLRTN